MKHAVILLNFFIVEKAVAWVERCNCYKIGSALNPRTLGPGRGDNLDFALCILFSNFAVK